MDGRDKRTDKLEDLLTKWQQETRDDLKRQGEKEFDFMAAPQGLLDRVKDHTRTFVEEQWTKLSHWGKLKSIVS